MIPEDKKEEVRQAADIVDVVSDHVKLRRSGNNFTGLCPFHNEKTPSFSVSPGLGIYKCFGCGEGGDVFNFVMQMDGVGFEEAVRTLADRYNVVIPEKQEEDYDPRQHLKDGIYHALRFAGNFYHQTLAESDEAEKAREYLRNRGYPWKTVRKYGLGFSPDRYDGLLKAAERAGINLQYLHEAGLVKSRDSGSGYYDTFRSRLMFPIFNPSGKVIAFGGRTLSDSKKIPKYINSPQTLVYNKSDVLYGIQIARNEIRKAGEAILVEGYTDVISLHQSGIGNVVSTSGTALTSGQMQILKRYGDILLMIFDADVAGVKAAVRGISVALEAGMGVRVLTLPDGEDPDSFVRQYEAEGFLETRKKETCDFLRYLVGLAQKEGRWEDPVERKKIIIDILEAIAVIPDELSRINYIQELSSISRIGDRTLLHELDVVRSRVMKQTRHRAARPGREQADSLHRPHPTEPSPAQAGSSSGTVVHGPKIRQPSHPDGTPQPESIRNRSTHTAGSSPSTGTDPVRVRRPEYEKELIRLMLTFGEKLIEFVGSHCSEKYFEDADLRKFYEDIMMRYQEGRPVSVEAYSRSEHPYPELIGEIVLERYSVSKIGMKKRGITIDKDADPVNTARGALKSIKLKYLDRVRDQLLNDLRDAEAGQKAEMQKLNTKVVRERSRLLREPLNKLFPET